ncbi:LysR family transcriptional regulator [Pararhodobacter marinus]|uniref:LysR family transcriptional regulator n=1 Tax=Pararhodobacter marinus TaxID=2184063 RepID=A0A2U2CI71_9RHOB|nr:LysR family transcriptional regulator [Pararhodobacter marinus]PWE31597.1 LysR family transcriptional regulator [Pararhodobacter marinus]
MKLSAEHLEILAVIVEKGGLTEGAEALGKSQPSVSRSMALLEQRVGLPLFEPGRRPLRPTELGLRLARAGAQIRAAGLEAGQIVKRFQRGQAGRLRMGGTPVFMDGVVSAIIADFQSRHSDVQIEQVYGYLDQLALSLRNEALDLAILPMHASQVPKDMHFTPLMGGHNVIVCRAGHPLTRRKGLTMQDIDSFGWIAPPTDSPLYRDLQRAVRSIGREDFHVSFSGGTLASILAVLTGSDALTVLPYSVAFLARRNTPLEILPIRIEHPDRHLGILRLSKARAEARTLTLFSGFVADELHRLQNRIDHELQVRRRG